MTSFLFIISFLLHIVSIAAIYALYKQATLPKKDDTSDIIELMESYLEEIKLENRLLQEEITRTGKVIPPPNSRVEKPTSEEPVANEDFQIPLINDQIQDDIEVSLQSRILKLYKEGLTVEEIARELGSGKTEVELIIKFHEKSNIKA